MPNAFIRIENKIMCSHLGKHLLGIYTSNSVPMYFVEIFTFKDDTFFY